MLDRRSFLERSVLANFMPLIGCSNAIVPETKKYIKPDNFELNKFQCQGNFRRFFISHRGVHLGSTIAAENSIESIRLARRAGFECIELDVRMTSDNHFVVMHDATLNRTVLNIDGSNLKEQVLVSSKTLHELQNNYILKAVKEKDRSIIPTLQEFLKECKRQGLFPFIENKLNDMPDDYYLRLIGEADEVLGKNRYVITSNNQTNNKIRKLGLTGITVMGILYQTTFEEISSLENVIIAISASRFKWEDYINNVRQSNLAGLPTESHADDFSRFTMINDAGIDYVSTDLLAPDIKNNVEFLINIYTDDHFNDFDFPGKTQAEKIELIKNQSLTLKEQMPQLYFGGLFFDIELLGICEIQLGNHNFSIDTTVFKLFSYQVLVYDQIAQFKISTSNRCIIKHINVKLVKY